MANFRGPQHPEPDPKLSYVKQLVEFEVYRNAVKPLHIPEFRGGSAPFEISVEMFVEIVDSLKSANGWTADQTAGKVSDKLQGEAARWRWTTYYEHEVITWDKLRPDMISHFHRRDQGMKSLMRAVRLLEQIEQRNSESVSDYFDRTNYLFNASAVDFLTDLKGAHAPGFLAHHRHMLLLHFIKGLQPALKDRLNVIVTQQNLTTMNDVLDAAVKIETSLVNNAKRGLQKFKLTEEI